MWCAVYFYSVRYLSWGQVENIWYCRIRLIIAWTLSSDFLKITFHSCWYLQEERTHHMTETKKGGGNNHWFTLNIDSLPGKQHVFKKKKRKKLHYLKPHCWKRQYFLTDRLLIKWSEEPYVFQIAVYNNYEIYSFPALFRITSNNFIVLTITIHTD